MESNIENKCLACPQVSDAKVTETCDLDDLAKMSNSGKVFEIFLLYQFFQS